MTTCTVRLFSYSAYFSNNNLSLKVENICSIKDALQSTSIKLEYNFTHLLINKREVRILKSFHILADCV